LAAGDVVRTWSEVEESGNGYKRVSMSGERFRYVEEGSGRQGQALEGRDESREASEHRNVEESECERGDDAV
jgi:hypothetical protein